MLSRCPGVREEFGGTALAGDLVVLQQRLEVNGCSDRGEYGAGCELHTPDRVLSYYSEQIERA